MKKSGHFRDSCEHDCVPGLATAATDVGIWLLVLLKLSSPQLLAEERVGRATIVPDNDVIRPLP